MKTWLQIAIPCLSKFISETDLIAWKIHIATQRLKNKLSFTMEEVSEVANWTTCWKFLMKKSFTNLPNSEGVKFSFNYPNFESESHWESLIPFVGPPAYQSTIHWENFHSTMKFQESATNHKNTKRDATITVIFHVFKY